MCVLSSAYKFISLRLALSSSRYFLQSSAASEVDSSSVHTFLIRLNAPCLSSAKTLYSGIFLAKTPTFSGSSELEVQPSSTGIKSLQKLIAESSSLTSVRILAVIGNIVTILSLGLPLFTDIVCIQVLYNILHNNAIKNGR